MTRISFKMLTGAEEAFSINAANLGDPMLIGSSSRCYVQLRDRGVLAEHATVRRHGPQWYIETLGGESMVSVNEKDVSRSTQISLGDVVGVGSFLIQVVPMVEGNVQNRERTPAHAEDRSLGTKGRRGATRSEPRHTALSSAPSASLNGLDSLGLDTSQTSWGSVARLDTMSTPSEQFSSSNSSGSRRREFPLTGGSQGKKYSSSQVADQWAGVIDRGRESRDIDSSVVLSAEVLLGRFESLYNSLLSQVQRADGSDLHGEGSNSRGESDTIVSLRREVEKRDDQISSLQLELTSLQAESKSGTAPAAGGSSVYAEALPSSLGSLWSYLEKLDFLLHDQNVRGEEIRQTMDEMRMCRTEIELCLAQLLAGE